jgi:energy-coupling factor transport system permease protein
MFKNVVLGRFVGGNSYIYSINPMLKIIAAIVLIILTTSMDSYIDTVIFCAFFLAVIKTSKLSLMYLLKALKPFYGILIFAAIVNFYNSGFHQAFFICLKICLYIICTVILTMTTTPLKMVEGIKAIISPFKKFGINVDETAIIMSISIRFIPIILEEADRLMKAQTARGISFKNKNLMALSKNIIALLGPLFIMVLKRTDQVAIALEARGYNGGNGSAVTFLGKVEKVDLAGMFVIVVFALLTWLF